jgi:hypothetical protein
MNSVHYKHITAEGKTNFTNGMVKGKSTDIKFTIEGR